MNYGFANSKQWKKFRRFCCYYYNVVAAADDDVAVEAARQHVYIRDCVLLSPLLNFAIINAASTNVDDGELFELFELFACRQLTTLVWNAANARNMPINFQLGNGR